ncbi:PC4-domain-containing protein [Auriscalpium vulgare]|uniref:PC4-domain-containing protein n=1 Tax=Auriscalpium vulgare TaxID=40419 RepID=A0ACB8S5A7_9AGAM|nr:PC4-domain-containing protein [Auriscalpium vulgare]
MGEKRKDASDSEQEDVPLANKKQVGTRSPKRAGKTKGDGSSKPAKKAAKKPRLEDLESSESVAESVEAVNTSPEGEKYIELGQKKRVTVRDFKGKTLIDIREFYGDAGEEKPGKKGISLSVEQWKSLSRSVGDIDYLISRAK